MQPLEQRPDPGRWPAIALTVMMHMLLVAALFFGIRWQNRGPESIEVEVWRAAPPPVIEAATKPIPEPPVQQKAEPPPPAKPDIALKANKPEPKKPEPKKPEPKPEVKKPEPPRPSFDDALQREIAQVERDKFQQQQQRRAEEDVNALKQAQAEQAAAARARGLADYVGRIRGKVRGNMTLPAGIAGNPEAVFEVVQLPSGEVLNVKLKKSSGHAALDSAIERAILKSSPLPKPPHPELFQRVLELRYRPLED